jgi:hypothetical protein
MNNDASLLTATESELMTAIRANYGDDYANEIIAGIEFQKSEIARANEAVTKQ